MKIARLDGVKAMYPVENRGTYARAVAGSAPDLASLPSR